MVLQGSPSTARPPLINRPCPCAARLYSPPLVYHAMVSRCNSHKFSAVSPQELDDPACTNRSMTAHRSTALRHAATRHCDATAIKSPLRYPPSDLVYRSAHVPVFATNATDAHPFSPQQSIRPNAGPLLPQHVSEKCSLYYPTA